MADYPHEIPKEFIIREDGSLHIQGGFVLVSRKLLDDALWTSTPDSTKVCMVGCILLANWEDKEWWDGQAKVLIKRGSFITSMKNLAARLNTSLKKTQYATQLLEKAGFVLLKGYTRYTLITVVNYEKYQDMSNYLGIEKVNEGKTKGKRKGTTKEHKGIEDIEGSNSNKEEEDLAAKPPSLLVEFSKRHQFYRDTPYVIVSGGKDGKLLATIEKAMGRPATLDCMNRFFEANPFEKGGYTVGVFSSVINKLVVSTQANHA